MKRRNRRAGRVRADSELVDPRALAPTDHMRERARTGAAVATELAS